MPSKGETSIKRTIRRQQLREMVPLADSTIYEMEQRGEFPRRFALSPRCVMWHLGEVEAWLASRRSAPIAPCATSRCYATALSAGESAL
jgi:prophage regulatory protein